MPSKPTAAQSAATNAAAKAAGNKPAARFRLRVNVGETIAVGPGKIALLEAVAESGSITAAAKRIGMSYRRAWLLLDELNKSLKKPAVDSAQGGQAGGGSVVTDSGRELIALYRRIEATAMSAAQDDLKRLVKLISG